MTRRLWMSRVALYLSDEMITHHYMYLVALYRLGESPEYAAQLTRVLHGRHTGTTCYANV